MMTNDISCRSSRTKRQLRIGPTNRGQNLTICEMKQNIEENIATIGLDLVEKLSNQKKVYKEITYVLLTTLQPYSRLRVKRRERYRATKTKCYISNM